MPDSGARVLPPPKTACGKPHSPPYPPPANKRECPIVCKAFSQKRRPPQPPRASRDSHAPLPAGTEYPFAAAPVNAAYRQNPHPRKPRPLCSPPALPYRVHPYIFLRSHKIFPSFPACPSAAPVTGKPPDPRSPSQAPSYHPGYAPGSARWRKPESGLRSLPDYCIPSCR